MILTFRVESIIVGGLFSRKDFFIMFLVSSESEMSRDLIEMNFMLFVDSSGYFRVAVECSTHNKLGINPKMISK